MNTTTSTTVEGAAAKGREGLSDKAIQEAVIAWYKKLDRHAPIVELFPMLADEGLEMVFPEATLRDAAGFEAWYRRVVRVFFDEVHTVKQATPTITGDKATVQIVVRWEASTWDPLEPRNKRIVLDAYQTWEMRLSSATGAPVITRYVVDRLEYQPGSARL
jgi:hypothetical protein